MFLARVVDALVEVGPGTVLSGLARRIAPGVTTAGVSRLEDARRLGVAGDAGCVRAPSTARWHWSQAHLAASVAQLQLRWRKPGRMSRWGAARTPRQRRPSLKRSPAWEGERLCSQPPSPMQRRPKRWSNEPSPALGVSISS